MAYTKTRLQCTDRAHDAHFALNWLLCGLVDCKHILRFIVLNYDNYIL